MRRQRTDSDLVASAIEHAVQLEWEDEPWDGATRSWLAGVVAAVVVLAGVVATLFAP